MTQSNSKRIAKNTVYMYIRMFFTVLVTLYTSRVVLRELGASDYGLYNVIGGILTMFTMFSAALTVGTQRFLSYAIGENDVDKLKRTFSMALLLHVGLAIVILVLLETFGLWFLNTFMNIPPGRENAAFWVFQFTIFGFMASLIQVPFQSCIIAHEKMSIYAYMGIYDAVMKLLLVFLLSVISYDKLIMYAILVFAVNLSSVLIYNFYSRHHFDESRFSMVWDKGLAREYVSYSGWNLIGGSFGFFTNQGINILLNIYCGTVVNAARGIAMTVNGQITNFVNNFQTAVNPQIIKLYAAKEYNELHSLAVTSSRIAGYLYLLIAIPIFIEIEFILRIWLSDYPGYTPIFVQLILIQSFWSAINYPISMLIHASGRMKWPSIWAGVMILIFPISWLVLKMGGSPVTVHIVSAIMWGYLNLCNLYFARRYTGISACRVLKEAYLNVFAGGSIMFLVPFFISKLVDQDWIGFLVVVSVSLLVSGIIIFFFGLTANMRKSVLHKLGIRVI